MNEIKEPLILDAQQVSDLRDRAIANDIITVEEQAAVVQYLRKSRTAEKPTKTKKASIEISLDELDKALL